MASRLDTDARPCSTCHRSAPFGFDTSRGGWRCLVCEADRRGLPRPGIAADREHALACLRAYAATGAITEHDTLGSRGLWEWLDRRRDALARARGRLYFLGVCDDVLGVSRHPMTEAWALTGSARALITSDRAPLPPSCFAHPLLASWWDDAPLDLGGTNVRHWLAACPGSAPPSERYLAFLMLEEAEVLPPTGPLRALAEEHVLGEVLA